MPDNYFARYLPLLIHFGIATALAGAIVILSQLVGQHKPGRAKVSPYECGVQPIGDAQGRFSVKFYLVAMLFILFDVEAVVRFLGNDGVHRDRAGRPLLCLEKRRARLGTDSRQAE